MQPLLDAPPPVQSYKAGSWGPNTTALLSATACRGVVRGAPSDTSRSRRRPHEEWADAAGAAPRDCRTRGRRRRRGACTTSRCSSSDVERTIALLPGPARVPAHRAVREPRLPGLDALLLRHRQRQPARVLRLPGLDLGDYAEVLGGLHHLAISVEPDRWEHLRTSSTPRASPTEHMSGSSLYFSGPDGERLELINDPLGEMYGTTVL